MYTNSNIFFYIILTLCVAEDMPLSWLLDGESASWLPSCESDDFVPYGLFCIQARARAYSGGSSLNWAKSTLRSNNFITKLKRKINTNT